MTQTIAPTEKMKRLITEYALNSSNIIPPQRIVPMIIIDYDDGTAFKEGNRLNKWFIVVILKINDINSIVTDSKRPRRLLAASSVSRSTSIKNLVATLLIPAYRPVMHDSTKRRMSKSLLSLIY